jgi:hypothetical protein
MCGEESWLTSPRNIAATVNMFSPYHQSICKSKIFAIIPEVEMRDILQETKSTHSSEYSFGCPDETGIKQSLICYTNSASVRTSESAQMNSSTPSNMATYYR